MTLKKIHIFMKIYVIIFSLRLIYIYIYIFISNAFTSHILTVCLILLFFVNIFNSFNPLRKILNLSTINGLITATECESLPQVYRASESCDKTPLRLSFLSSARLIITSRELLLCLTILGRDTGNTYAGMN